MKTIDSITIGDLMSENMDVWIKKNKKFGFDLEIDDENNEPLVRDNGLHDFAAESLADFCRQYLSAYDKTMRAM